jgi:NAD+ diphosphatase
MIQDIAAPLTLFPECTPNTGDFVFQCKGAQIAVSPWTRAASVALQLVKVGETTFFLGAAPDAVWGNTQILRQIASNELRFGAFCANHLAQWYLNHRWCGRCGTMLARQKGSLKCTTCGHEIYPTIAPAVIVALINKGHLLVTRYADRPYSGPALVAGYCEVGETAETTCVREALEETGLHVTRVRYFASQPWGLSGSLLLGFFAETSDEEITLADGELATADWLAPEALPPPPDAAGPLSLTATMIKAFAEGFKPF